MSFINNFIAWYFKRRIPRINHFKTNPGEVQDKLLKELIQSASNTEWGKKYRYKNINSYTAFREQVPVQSYGDVRPFAERMMKGEQNILWPSEIQWFAKSSGTTADKSKYIPISKESLSTCHYRAGKDVLTLYCNNYPDTGIFDGKGLILGGSHKVSEFNKNAFVGDLSAVLLQNAPFYSTFHRIPDLSIALLDNWEEKLDKLAHAAYRENVTNVSGVPSWNLVLMKRILEITGRNNILEVWPKMEVFIHGGVNFAPYRSQYENLLPSPEVRYLETYNASEGFFGIQDKKEGGDMLLMLDYGIFYEFIPMDEFGSENPTVLSLNEVQADVNYAMVISTNAGLWRYLIGDTVRFTSLDPYRVKVSGRTRNFINAFGEELIVDNTDSALKKACEQTGAIMTEYTAAPIYLNNNESAAHEYVIEFEKEPEDLNQFTNILDEELKKLNSDYEAKRSANLLLKKPKITNVPHNTFFKWLKSKGRIGGQNKVPRLYNNRKYIDEILLFLKK